MNWRSAARRAWHRFRQWRPRAYDFFVSYTRRDARDYAVRLAHRLRDRHEVFLDEEKLEAGERLREIERIAARSTVLIVVASPRIAESPFVPREVAAARKRRRRIIAIDVSNTVSSGRAGPVLQAKLLQSAFVTETASLTDGPSPPVVDRLLRSLGALRRRTVRGLLLAVAALTFAALLGFLALLEQRRSDQVRLAGERQEQARRTAFGRQLERARALAERDPMQAVAILEDPVSCPPDLRDVAWSILRASSERLRWSPPAVVGPQNDVGWLATNELVTLGRDGRLAHWRIPDGRPLSSIPLPPSSRWLDLDPNARLVAVADDDTGVVEFRKSDGTTVGTIAAPTDWPAGRARWTKGRFLAKGSRFVLFGDRPISIRRVPEGSEVIEESRSVRAITAESFEDASSSLVDVLEPETGRWTRLFLVNTVIEDYVESSIRTTDESGRVVILDRASGMRLLHGAVSSSGRIAVVAQEEDRAIALGGVGFLRMAELSSLAPLAEANRAPMRGQRFSRLDLPQASAVLVAVKRANHPIYAATESGWVDGLDPGNDRGTTRWRCSERAIDRLVLSPDETAFATIDQDGATRVWSTRPWSITVEPRLEPLGSSLSRRLRVLVSTPSRHVIYAHHALNADAGAGFMVRTPGEGRWLEVPGFQDPIGRAITYLDLPEEWTRRAGLVRALLSEPPIVVTPDSSHLLALDRHPTRVTLARDTRSPGSPEEESIVPPDRDRAWVDRFAGSPSSDRVVVSWLPLEGDDLPLDGETGDHLRTNAMRSIWSIEVWPSRASGVLDSLLTHATRPEALAWSPRGGWIAASLASGDLHVWRTSNLAAAAFVEKRSPGQRTQSLVFDPEDRLLLSLENGADHSVTLRSFDLSRSRLVASWTFTNAVAGRCTPPSADHRVAVGFLSGEIAVVDLERHGVLRYPGDPDSSIAHLEYSTDGRTLLRVSVDSDGSGSTALCDPRTGQPWLDLEASGVAMDASTFLAGDDGIVAIGGDDRVYTFRGWVAAAGSR